ncbi:MAG: cytochrome P450 [Planctomycetia bacterium]
MRTEPPAPFAPPAGFFADPYPYYRRLLAADGPVYLEKTDETGIPGVWLVSRYDDALEILKATAEVTKNPARVADPAVRRPGILDDTMLHADPPDHTRLRRVVREFFAQPAVDALAPTVAMLVDELLEPLVRRREADFITEFAGPLPMRVISLVLGVPREDADHLRSLVVAILAGTDSLKKTAAVYAGQQQAARELAAYFESQLERRRRQPAADLLTAVAVAHGADATLSTEELRKMCIFLLVTGYESTVGLLGNGLLSLLRFPAEAARLAADPALVPTAVEEMLRFESPFQRTSFRAFTAPFTLRGHAFNAGEQVAAILGAANRDPRRFPDPDRFDVGRSPNPHLAFGAGLHQCLGALVARMEGRAAFARLAPHVSRLALAAAPRWGENSVLRTLESLPLEIRGQS